ncbi:MAG: helicase-related protein [Acidobacteria bacterium]|nr:helicase-related protein [Acidobacteriota bacterium]
MAEFSSHQGPQVDVDVRRLRGRLGLTQEQFAERLGVSTITVHRWESGQSHPRRLALEKLAQLRQEAAAAAAASQAQPLRTLRPAARQTVGLDFAGDPEAVLAVADALRLSFGRQFNPAFAIETSRIHPLLHQRFAVYERMLKQDPLRFLLADDAGAGKTIMTGLYVREMMSRERLERVLIVPPAGLVGNWRRELWNLFRLDFRIVDGADARADNPFRGSGGDRVIVSLDTLAGDKMFDVLRRAGSGYDLVVFDEAHKLSVHERGNRIDRTRRYQLAEALAVAASLEGRFGGLDWTARHLLLLTATPHMGQSLPYAWLWRLLDVAAFGAVEAVRRASRSTRDRHFLRRTKEEMTGLDGQPLYPPRKCDTFSYRLSGGEDGEQNLYERTTQYLDECYGRALDNQPAVELAKTVFQRRLASSTWALLRSFERRIEKLTRTAEAIENGELTAELLLQRQRRLSERHRQDYFDDAAADDDVAADGWAEGNEAYEDAVLGAVTAVGAEELRREAEQVEDLAGQARQLIASGTETKFEQLRQVLEDPDCKDEKWLIFSEHRDTVNHLVRRLEGLGYRGYTAQIHGGMDWRERERQVAAFRRPNGARYMVATDAAGEGINLQFCRLMVNYDIPWNPARLEQRMGRIHRYGQRFEVRIFNLVAGSTREGRVLRVLLDKLDAIREELSSDKVFDVVGRLFEGASLTRFMARATSDEGERRAVERVEQAVDAARVKRIDERDADVYGVPEATVTGEDLRPEVERERYLHLLPAHVRRLVERGARLLDLTIKGDLDDRFALAPARRGALDRLLPAFDTYPHDAREWLTTRRPQDDDTGIWLHPGEPLFDALCDEIRTRFRNDALRGSIFVDSMAEEPYLLHLAEVWVEQEAATDDPARRRVVERRLVALRQRADEPPEQCPVERVLLLAPTGLAPGMAPLAPRAVDLRAQAGAFLGALLEDLTKDLRGEREADLPERCRRTAVGFDLRASELASLRSKLARSGRRPAESAGWRLRRGQKVTLHRTEAEAWAEAQRQEREKDRSAEALKGALIDLAPPVVESVRDRGGDELAAVKAEQKRLSSERQLALERIEAEPRRILPGGHHFLLHALVVRPEDAGPAASAERLDVVVEELAVRIAADRERARRATVQDVSKPVLARAAGLSDWPGFDLLSTLPSGEQRCIEVKGRAGRAGVPIQSNEWEQACKLRRRYWLYVVLDCAGPQPELLRICDPFHKLLASQRTRAQFDVPLGSLIEAAETRESKLESRRGPD